MSNKIRKLAVGESDFKQVISGHYYYVDVFIKEKKLNNKIKL
ncbi:MAG TPA: hypothetical protein VK186_07225 [Candidatus Deferrimicrobium sp.]|nr:hypothetical protein [Candidatus Kapabacteria bacterium]HLP58601.1 hypothetical protein [Candidatus Deferrimicrobium sp.]